MIEQLCLHAQMEAWLTLKPGSSERTNAELYDAEPIEVDDECCHLTVFLQEAGICGYGAMGAIPLTFTELRAWADMTGKALSVFEAKVLVQMSTAYAAFVRNPDARCPVETDDMRESIEETNVASWLALAN